jgi:16S rRNA (cytosine(967)-C(5))-methyltransferase
MRNYFKVHKAVGSKDRAYIADTSYAMVRWKGLLDYLCGPEPTWEKRLDAFSDPSFEAAKHDKTLPQHIRLSFPKILFDLIASSHGSEGAEKICTISNQPAPTTVRANTLKISRDELLRSWSDKFEVKPCSKSSSGIVFAKRINFFELPEFKQGLFEVQDEGSQLLADLVDAKPGDLVFDYCAGAGGKTLAFAPKMENKGQIYLHDIRKHALIDCKKRLRRAGIQNAQIVHSEEDKLKKLKKKMDWVLVDAPCTGTGTLRRNPDMKWKFDDNIVQRLRGQQRMIFEKALSFLKPGGKIVYATCSLLKEENSEQITHFMKTYGLKLHGEPFESLPEEGGMDGFYGAVLFQ